LGGRLRLESRLHRLLVWLLVLLDRLGELLHRLGLELLHWLLVLWLLELWLRLRVLLGLSILLLRQMLGVRLLLRLRELLRRLLLGLTSANLDTSRVLCESSCACRRLLDDCGLSHVDLARIAGVKECEILLEAGTAVVSSQSRTNVSPFIRPDRMNVVSKNSVESLAAAFHEPDLEMRISGQ
jgi:hypothetical protein